MMANDQVAVSIEPATELTEDDEDTGMEKQGLIPNKKEQRRGKGEEGKRNELMNAKVNGAVTNCECRLMRLLLVLLLLLFWLVFLSSQFDQESVPS